MLRDLESFLHRDRSRSPLRHRVWWKMWSGELGFRLADQSFQGIDNGGRQCGAKGESVIVAYHDLCFRTGVLLSRKVHEESCGRMVCWVVYISMDTDWFLHDDTQYRLRQIFVSSAHDCNWTT